MAGKAIAVKKYVVRLDAEERDWLNELIRKGKRSAQLLTKARILLKADVSDAGEGWSDSRIAAALDTSIATVERTRRMKDLRPIYLGDDLFACQPICEAVLAVGGDFLMTAKPDTHKTLYDFMNGAELDEVSVARKQGAKKLTFRYRWFAGAPLREGKDALNVNWIGLTIADAKGKLTYDGAFVTSLKVVRENVAEIAACARARWKIENETFNILKNNGYHLEHHFGHGKQNLAMLFAAMNLLAFAFHTVCDGLEDLWIKARKAKRARKRFFEHIRTITAYLVFPDWETLITTLIKSKPPPEIEKQIWA